MLTNVTPGDDEDPVARVLPELYALTPIEQYPVRALAVTRRLVSGDKGDYTEVNVVTHDFRVLVDPEPPELRLLGPARAAYMGQHPVLRHYLRNLGSEGPSARLISDFLRPAEFHRMGLYGEFFRPLGVEDQLTVKLGGHSQGRTAGISIDRGIRCFTEHERKMLDRLQPHLTAARDNAARFSQALSRARLAEQEGTSAVLLDRLTGRERDVLARIAAGRTNAQIARALDISVGTVRKHVEHILHRLGVQSRTAAAVCYITGSIPERSPWTAALAPIQVR
jgi:DNA-binding CsgD family transcriptional regulator